MEPIIYIDRKTKKRQKEKVYGAVSLKLLYGDGALSRLFGAPLAYLLARIPWISACYGWLQNRPFTAEKISPFIQEFDVDVSEFEKDPKAFTSFNDFFKRRLKASARPIAPDPKAAIIPADGRYFFYQNGAQADGFCVKGEKFMLADLLQDQEMAKRYAHGAMAIARLCPSDYHRYHFPCDCIPRETRLINGWLYSVNPASIKKNIHVFTQNKRTLCMLKTTHFGDVLFLEIGATCVGAIHETYTPGRFYAKGEEKGYFSFGGSSLILIFPPNAIAFDQDLLEATAQNVEIKCLMGQSMGLALS